MTEWHVEPNPATIKAGKVHFVVENAGFVSHELVIVRGDDPESLPTDASGAVDEARIAKQDRIGRVGIVAPRETKKAMLDLTPGEYVLFCNVVDKQSSSARQGFSHFAERMVDTLTVTK